MSLDARFALHFTAAIEANAFAASCDGAPGSVKLVNPSAESFSYEVFNSENQFITSGQTSSDVIIENLNAGNYIIRLEMNDGYNAALQAQVDGQDAIQMNMSATDAEINEGEGIELNATANGQITWLMNGILVSEGTTFIFEGFEPGIYAVQVNANNGTCSLENTIYITVRGDVSTGINQNNHTGFETYPNPATDLVSVTVPVSFAGKTANMEMFDTQGKLILSQTVSVHAGARLDVSLNGIESGLYLLTLTGSSDRYISRVVVK
jgi:hypothetical protein